MFGRLQNQVYLDFMKKLKKFEDFPTAENKVLNFFQCNNTCNKKLISIRM